MAVVEDPEGNEYAALALAQVSFYQRRILEVGCGDGRLTNRYAHRAASVVAIDPDADAVARLAADLPRVDARCLSIEQLELPDQSVDIVLFAWSL